MWQVAFVLPAASSLKVKSMRLEITLETLAQMNMNVPVAVFTADSLADLSVSLSRCVNGPGGDPKSPIGNHKKFRRSRFM